MTFTPLVRWKNFKVENLSYIIGLLPNWAGTEPVEFDAFNAFMNSRLSSYQRTAYQFAGQLGLVDREPSSVRVNQYLDYSNTQQLQQYLTFWFKTYYGPNPYIRSGDQPIIIYRELINAILNEPTHIINFDDFLNSFGISSGSNDILENAIKAFASPVEFITGTKNLTVNNLEQAQHELSLIDSNFQIPANYNQDNVFFDRYNEQNFNLFNSLFLSDQAPIDKNHNRLINGAPGTGKSHLLQQEALHYLGDQNNNYLERETFHLTYSYQQFVGTYKPVPFNGSVTYQYVPGPFLRHLVKAIKMYELNGPLSPNFIFIIEEINRAKSPDGVFGNIFQLLDRDSTGKSKYEITCSEDMKLYLANEGLSHLDKLYLPPNFYIWATMNNADQGVQAIDSAFFRRWEPEYISIDNNESEISTIEVEILGYGLSNWNNFRKELNKRLLELGVKEDKLIGPFFIDPQKLQTDFDEVYTNKLLRYLFEDVLKFKRPQFFGSSKYFQEVIDEYNNGSLNFIGLNASNFVV